MKNKGISIVTGKRPIYETVFATVCFTLAFFLAYVHFSGDRQLQEMIPLGGVWIFGGIWLFAFGVSFSRTKDFHFDFDKKRYKIQKRIGPIGFGKWQPFEQLDYISVFRKRPNDYRLKMFFDDNKHFLMTSYFYKNKALKSGKELASGLQLDLLDNTGRRGKSKWIRKEDLIKE